MFVKFKNTIIPANSPMLFQAEVFLEVLESITQQLTPVELGNLEKTSRSSKYHMERMYARAYQQYFPHISKEIGLSSKKALEQTTRFILKAIKKKYGIAVSPYTFFEIASGREKPLSQAERFFGREQQLWLGAIQYSYHLDDTENLPKKGEERSPFIRKTAYVLSLLKKYSAIETLWDRHQSLFIESRRWSSFEAACFFYATYGHLQKLQDLLRNETLNRQSISVRLYAIIFVETLKYGDEAIVTFLLGHPLAPGEISLFYRGEVFLVACEYGCLAIVKCLLEHAFWQGLPASYKGEALLLAFKNHHHEVVAFFLKDLLESVSAQERREALRHVFASNEVELVRMLLAHPLGQMVSSLDKSQGSREKLIVLRNLVGLTMAGIPMMLVGFIIDSRRPPQEPDIIVSLPDTMRVLFTTACLAVPFMMKSFFPSNAVRESITGKVNRWTAPLRKDALIMTSITKEAFQGLFAKSRAAAQVSGAQALALQEAPVGAQVTVPHAAP